MRSARTGELTVIAFAVVVVVVASMTAALGGASTDDTLPAGSSFSYAGSGTAAAYQTLQRLGYSVRRSTEPVLSYSAGHETASAGHETAVLVLANPGEPASNQDRRAIRTFLANGGVVLSTGCAGATFLSSDASEKVAPLSLANTYTARHSSPLTRDAPSISMTAGCENPRLDDRYAPVYGRGPVDVVYEARIGQGAAIWWAGTTPIENATIDAPGHLELLLNAIGPRPRTIVWDEFYHGQRASLWSYLARTPAPWALAQLAIVSAVAAMMFVRRRLPIRGRVAAARTNPLEFVDTIARLYTLAGSGAAAVDVARTRLRRLLLATTGVPQTASDAQLADAAAARVRMPSDELRELLETAERSSMGLFNSPEAALPLVRRMQAVAARINGA
jgi:hypothetical protein